MKQIKATTTGRESEKAVEIVAAWKNGAGESSTWTMWVPKSQSEIEGDVIRVADWLIEAKEKDIAEGMREDVAEIIIVGDETGAGG